MKEYGRVQIIKHALQHYITRQGATDKELAQEKRLLQDYTERAEVLKQIYRIKTRRGRDSMSG